MNSKMMTKILAASLAFLLSFANVALLGGHINKIYAASTELEEQQTRVDKSEIEFDAYFQENGEVTHSKVIDVKNGANLYLSFKVADGYLANGQVVIDNANFKVQEMSKPSEMVQNISSSENKVNLNKINRDESVVLEIPVNISTASNFDVKDISKTAKVNFTGTYVNNKGKEVEVNKTIEVQTSIGGETKSFLNGEVTKYVTFDVNGNKGVILQTMLTSNLVDNALPVKTTKLEIEVPVINNINPKNITLSAKSLMATRGEGAKVFTENDYTYENGKITLNINNNDSILSWVKDAKDEIILTCIYGEDAIVDNAKVKFSAKSAVTCYLQDLTTVETEVNGTLELKEQIGEIVTLDNNTNLDSLYKGYMLEKNGKVTSFINNIGLNIGYHELMDSISFDDKLSYVDSNENLYPSNANYKYVKVKKENILEILGEDGYINVYSKTGEKITTLNKDNTEYIFENEASGITYETSKLIAEGILELECKREIPSLEYSKEQMEMFNKVRVSLNANIKKDNKVIISGKQETNIKLENPTSQAELTLSNSNISTVVTNEGIELRVTLKTTGETTKLYKNPEVTIEFPSYITNVDIENVKLVYEKDLKITSAQMYKNANGNIEVKIKLEGEQTSHNENAITEGATLVMKADIKANSLTPTSTNNINLKVKNANGNEEITVPSKINFVAPAGIATVSQVTGYSDEGESAVSISGKMGVGELETGANSKTANVKIIAINNYTYDCDNVVILGRTPTNGNKAITTNKELGSTFSAKMVSEIKSANGLTGNDMTVYYSANNSANSNLEDKNNGWTSNKNEVEKVASYMIVLNENHKLTSGEVMAFDYDIEIPENLKGNEETYATFAMYYKEDEEAQDTTFEISRTMSVESTPIALSTGKLADLSVVLSSNVTNNSEVTEKSFIEYTAKITNNGNYTVDGVFVVVHVPSNSAYVNPENGKLITGDVQIIVGSVKPGAENSEEVKFTLKMGSYNKVEITEEETEWFDEDGNKIEEPEDFDMNLTREDFDTDEEYEEYLQLLEEHQNSSDDNLGGGAGSSDADISNNKVSVKVTVGVTGEKDTTDSNTVDNVLKEGEPTILMNVTTNNQGYIYANGKTEIEYVLTLKKENVQTSLKNVVVKFKVPDGLTFKSSSVDYASNNNGEITWNFNELNSVEYITVKMVANDISGNSLEKTMPVTFTSTCDGSNNTFKSNTINTKSYKQGFVLTQKSNIETGTISGGDEVRFTVKVRNSSPQNALFTITDTLPNELSFVEYYYTRNGERVSGNNAPNITLELNAGEELEIYVIAKAKMIKDESKQITNQVVLNSSQVKDLKANDIVLTLKGSGENPGGTDDPNNPSNPNDPNNPNGTYNISGTAWLDENADGKRDEGEKLLSGIKVYLLDSTKSNVVNTTVTDSKGVYNFKNIGKGSYVVVFEYDNKEYALTTYKKEGIDSSVNSDVIDMELTINGKKDNYAVSNNITLNSNVYNVDLGLINSPKFHLELKKGVSLMQVSNNKGVQSYTFDDVDSAQVQIAEKDLNGTVVAITYKISVTNTGTIGGYANKIVDYKPKDLNFSSALNPEWYEDKDGNLYTTSLSGREIKPGETVELSLILTKKMTSTNLGISNNAAEIYESSNDLGISDLDSTPGNKNSSEDDYGLADVIITLKTGGPIFYGGIVLIVLAIFAFGAYEINKKVLRKI